MKLVLKFLASYGYHSFDEFLLSLSPSFKYNLQSFTITMSLIAAFIDHVFGIGPGLAVAMFIAVIIETWSGIKASKIKGICFESFRFSRCILKVAVWFGLLYLVHAFEMDFADKQTFFAPLAHLFFQLIFIVILTYFLIEYVTSILENYGVISGRGKDALINTLKELWTNFVTTLKPNNKNENNN